MTEDEWRSLQDAYANAMWTWANIEGGIFTVYAAAIGVLRLDLRPIQAAFFAINSFQVRLKSTHAAVEFRWRNHERFKRWADLRNRCNKASTERGRIAHKAGVYFAPQKPYQQPLHILLQPFWDPRHPPDWGTAKSLGIDAEQLRKWSASWHSVGYDLNEFTKELWGEVMVPPVENGQKPSEIE
jgi:hypothetical protein